MNRYIANSLGIVSIAAVLAIAGAAGDFWWIEYHANVPLLDATRRLLDGANQALDTVNRPCAPGPCGALANVDKLTVKVGDLAVTSQRQVGQTDSLVASVAADVGRTTETMGQVGASVQRTADAATGALQSATTTIDSLRVGLEPLFPASSAILSRGNATLGDLDSRINEFKPLEANLTGMTGNLNGITLDGKRISDDLTVRYFTPVPWWKKTLPYVSGGVKIASYALPF